MPFRTLLLLVLANLAAAFQTHAADTTTPDTTIPDVATVHRALDAMKTYSIKNLPYRLTETGEVNRTILHAPERPEAERLQLETLDGRAATEEEKKRYLEERAKSDARKKEREAKKGKKFETEDMVQRDSLIFLREENGQSIWGFKIPNEAFEEMGGTEKLEGELRLCKQQFVCAFQIRLREPMRVKLVAKFEKFVLDTRYVEHAGQWVPLRVESEMKGSIAGLKDLSQKKLQIYEVLTTAPVTVGAAQ